MTPSQRAQRAIDQIEDARAKAIAKERADILLLLRVNGPMQALDVARAGGFGAAGKTMRNRIQALLNKGLVTRHPTGKWMAAM